MNRYEPPTSHPAIGFAAMALAATTFVLFVVVPAQPGTHGERQPAAVASTAAAPVGTEVIIHPARIDVFGDREEKTAFEPVPQVKPKQKHAG